LIKNQIFKFDDNLARAGIPNPIRVRGAKKQHAIVAQKSIVAQKLIAYDDLKSNIQVL
jgi:hypothetical protein